MSKTDEAKGLLAVAIDDTRPAAERLAAYQAANAIRKELKVGWPKIHPRGLPLHAEALEKELDRALAAASDGLVAPGDEVKDLGPSEAPKPKRDPVVENASKAVKPPKPKAEKAPKPPKEPTDADRGKLSALVRKLLLTTDSPYSEIVAEVKRQFPDAETTNRSVASVASDMRGKGEKVAQRRKAAAS